MTGQGAYILGCAGPRLGPEERAFFAEAQPWGFILFARNVEDPGQLRRLTADLRAALGRDAPILIDQEGGRVQRMRAPHWREWLPPLDQAMRAGDRAPRAFELRYRIIAQELREVGIDVDCVPCGDLARPETHAILKNRCYGSDVDPVVALGRAVARALIAGGVLPVMKHMPGHGRAMVDSHLEPPRVPTDAATLRATDFAVFRGLNDLPMGMTSHLVFEALSDRPATIDPAMIALIRDEIGFGGLLMTDDISMQALSGTVAQRGVAALAAGCDLVLHCNGDMAEMATLPAALGPMTDAAQARAEAALALRHAPQPIDIAAAEAELEALMAER
ncbi:glycoside hydrolase family 3 N-terminal domain-containing protein [Palleronia sp. KMU-117]|uniref:glycoside hydrolase family 3 N-terminal domain-containing protein n=1 Tax=Palleronia sp. KMU-117 TaxID=3434108 RepID=UPI003D72001F